MTYNLDWLKQALIRKSLCTSFEMSTSCSHTQLIYKVLVYIWISLKLIQINTIYKLIEYVNTEHDVDISKLVCNKDFLIRVCFIVAVEINQKFSTNRLLIYSAPLNQLPTYNLSKFIVFTVMFLLNCTCTCPAQAYCSIDRSSW